MQLTDEKKYKFLIFANVVNCILCRTKFTDAINEIKFPLMHNETSYERHGVLNYRQLEYLFNSFFGLITIVQIPALLAL